MNKQEFQEYYKKNKIVVIGVPIIILVLLVDFLILKPARQRKLAERRAGIQRKMTQTTTPAAATGATASQAKPPIKMPDPIRPPSYPPLGDKVVSRFQLNKVYPYSTSQRNIFIKEEHKIEIIPQAVEEEATIERPEISYHGFFTLGPDKVAILKSSDQLRLTKVGNMMKNSPFRLTSIFPDRVVMVDTSEANREFEIALSENSSEGGIQK